MVTAKTKLNIEHLRPAPEVYEAILPVLQQSEDGLLTPVFEKLEGKYSYEDVRLVRLFMQMKE